MGRRLQRISTLAAVALLFAGGTGARAKGWEWEIVPFVWISDAGVDVSLNETDIVDTTIDFSDLIDKADLGALVHFEGQKGRGGLFVDVVYMSLSDDQTTSGRPLIPDGTIVDAELDQLIGEVGGFYRLTGDEKGLDLLFGTRVMDVSLEVIIDFPDTSLLTDRSRSGDESFLDGFAGLRFRDDISERWQWSIRGDVGTGDTDLTWNGVLTFGAKLGKQRDKTLYFGYRHLVYEFDEGTNGITERELEFSGPAVGFGFAF